MFCAKIASDKHPNSKSYCPRDPILSSCHDPKKCPNEPKYSEDTCDSFGLKGRQSQDEGIVEIVPDSRSRWEHIPDDRKDKISKESKVPSNKGNFFGTRSLTDKWDDSEYEHAEPTTKIYDRIWERDDEIWSEEAPRHQSDPSSEDEITRDVSTFVEMIESTEGISDLPELECDPRHLWWYSHHYHESDTECRDSSWRKTPEIRREDSDKKDEYYFDFFGHIILFEGKYFFCTIVVSPIFVIKIKHPSKSSLIELFVSERVDNLE